MSFTIQLHKLPEISVDISQTPICLQASRPLTAGERTVVISYLIAEGYIEPSQLYATSTATTNSPAGPTKRAGASVQPPDFHGRTLAVGKPGGAPSYGFLVE